MATVRILRSTTAGSTPTALVSGQLAINEADGKLFYRNLSGNVTPLPTGSIPDPYDLGTYPLITISSQPSNATIVVGQSTSVSITAAATSPTATISYQWQLSTNSGSTWSNVSGATSSSLTITTPSQGTYQYRCYLTANLSQVYSSTATVQVNPSFTPTAVLLTSGTSYTVPAGASSMTAWAVGGGGGSSLTGFGGQAGGVAFKTWTVSGGQTVSYVAGQTPTTIRAGYDSTVTFSGTTITGFGGAHNGGATAGGFSGGDGGATGGSPVARLGQNTANARGGGVGGNAATVASCGRQPMSNVSGLIAALQLAGATTSETCAATAAFGSGGYQGKFTNVTPGIGGGSGGWAGNPVLGTGGAVVLYFT